MPKTIEILVSPQGDTTISTHGFIGGQCRVATQHLEAALGHSVGEQLTAEYYSSHETESRQQQHLDGS